MAAQISQKVVPFVPKRSSRLGDLTATSKSIALRTGEFLDLAKVGLRKMHRKGNFAHTLRAVAGSGEEHVELQGENLRYTAISALGISQLAVDEQRRALNGLTASNLTQLAVARAELSDDAGAIALAAWASAEVDGVYAGTLLQRLDTLLVSGVPVDTVDCAWMLSAAVAAHSLSNCSGIIARTRDLLIQAQHPSGLFPHRLPASAGERFRTHVGCFADQVYPIQALARCAKSARDDVALTAANACAKRICDRQGAQGQWWWHYDVRNGSVVEGYPVYSVHQHAMAPMALLDLLEAGGTNHMVSIARGLDWLDRRPETAAILVDPQIGVIWRKVARREPHKATRALAALTTALKPGFQLPGLRLAFPPAVVDYECRPYELGWMLYAWLSRHNT